MRLSKRSEYGLKALIELATYYGQGVVQAPQIARKHQISVKFLELILLDLRRAGILHSRQGVHGAQPGIVLKGSGGSARCCYVAGCALASRRRRRGFTGVLSLRSPSATVTGLPVRKLGNQPIAAP